MSIDLATETEFTVGEGVLAAMRQNDDEPRGNETYFNASFSFTPGRDFAYLYSIEANQTYKLPKA